MERITVARWWLRNDRQRRGGSSCTVTLVSLCGHDRRLSDVVKQGGTLAEIARELNVSRATASKWWHRFLADPNGDWFEDRSLRPRTCPHQTPAEVEAAIVRLRHQEKLGPARIGYRLDMPASTVWKVLRRHQINRLMWMDRPTGRVVRRYEKDQAGELIHIDTKKVAKIPTGGGLWAWGKPHGNT